MGRASGDYWKCLDSDGLRLTVGHIRCKYCLFECFLALTRATSSFTHGCSRGEPF